MRVIFLLCITSLLTACAFIDETASTCPGLRSYDPQFCRGQGFQQLPNFEHEALIRRQRGEYW
jgi:hypothetical protein